MEVWGTPVMASVEEILSLLQTQVRAQGIDLLQDMKPTHNNMMVTCISHGEGKERKPSLGVSTEDVYRDNTKIPAGTCHCFTCGYQAELAEFISHCFGYQDKGMHGYKWITQNFVNLSIEYRKPLELNLSRNVVKQEEKLPYITEQELQKYRFNHPYMYERKLTDKVIEYFDVGYDREKQSLTFPVHDLQGNAVLIQRRSVNSKVFINDEGANKGDYLYGLYQVYKNLSWIKELYLCESPIDALTCWTHRVPAVAFMTARATARQIELLMELPIRKFVSALDNDEAGNNGTAKLAEQLSNRKVLYRLQYPGGTKDVNAMTTDEFSNRKTSIFI